MNIVAQRAALLGAVALAPFAIAPASAQASAQATPAAQPVENAAAAQTSSTTSDILVTARRRSESIQNVPVAITAFGAAQLADRQIHSEADLQRSVPGLTTRETEGSNQVGFSIRGQTVDAFTGSALAVVSYIDEVQANGGGASSYYDLESIQALKGPQGTLFGRNATGGAVLFSTAKPTNDLGMHLSMSYGNYNYVDVKGSVNIPIVDGRALLRLAGNVVRRDGYQKNVFTGPTNLSRLGATDKQSGRASLTLKPFDSLTNTTVAEYTQSGGNSTSTVPWSVNQPGQVDPSTGLPLNTATGVLFSPSLDAAFGFPGAWAAYLAAHPGANPGGYSAVVARQKQLGAYAVDVYTGGTPMFFKGHNYYAVNTTTLDLGGGTLVKNIFGYTKSYAHYNVSEQGSPYLVQCTCNIITGDVGNLEKNRGISDELQLQGKAFNNALTYILGAYYYKSNSFTHWPQTYFELQPLSPGVGVTSEFANSDQSKAIFAQGSYDFSGIGMRGLSLTAGYRYTWEKVTVDQLPAGNQYNYPDPNARNHLSTKFKKPSWTVGLDYKPTNDLLLYVVHRGSWRTGGLNGSAPPILAPAAGGGAFFEPETAKDIEGGLKWGGRVLDRPAHFNVAVYKMWIKNVQRAEFPSVNGTSLAVTINVPEAQVKGFEVDAAVRPIDWLEVGGNLALTDAKFTNNRVNIFGNLFVFDTYADTPKWAGTAYAQITLPVDESIGKVRLRGDIYKQTGQWFSNNGKSAAPNTKLPGYSLINMRLDWSKIENSRMSAALFVTNLTNKEYYVGGLSQSLALGENSATPGRPRMYGLELKYDF